MYFNLTTTVSVGSDCAWRLFAPPLLSTFTDSTDVLSKKSDELSPNAARSSKALAKQTCQGHEVAVKVELGCEFASRLRKLMHAQAGNAEDRQQNA
jgi:hypothetical protein